jgi:hypothetical protein
MGKGEMGVGGWGVRVGEGGGGEAGRRGVGDGGGEGVEVGATVMGVAVNGGGGVIWHAAKVETISAKNKRNLII